MFIIGEITPNRKKIIIASKDKFMDTSIEKKKGNKTNVSRINNKSCPRCKAAVFETYQADVKSEEKCSNGCYVIYIED